MQSPVFISSAPLIENLRRYVRKYRRETPVFILILAAGFHALTLMRYPPMFIDEAWLGARAWGYIQNGRVFGALDEGVLDRFTGYWTFFPFFPTLLQSIGMRFSTVPELLPLRIVSLILGIVLLYAVYLIGTRWKGEAVGLLGIVLVSISWPFYVSAHLARQDIFVAALCFLAIAAYFYNDKDQFWPGLLSGIFIGIAFEMHVNAVIYLPVFIAFYWIDHHFHFFRSRSFWGFCSGLAIAILFYLFWHILPYPETYLAISQLGYGATHLPPVLSLHGKEIFNSFRQLFSAFVNYYILVIPLMVLSAIDLLRGDSWHAKKISLMNILLILNTAFLVQNKFFYYMILITPGFGLQLAFYLTRFLKRPFIRSREIILRFSLVGILLACLFGFSMKQAGGINSDNYALIQNKLNEVIRPGEKVFAVTNYWFGLYEHPFISYYQLDFYRRIHPGSTFQDAMAVFQPDIFIRDAHIDFITSDQPFENVFFELLRIPAQELEKFILQRAELITELEDPYFGYVRVYRLIWQ